MFEGEVARESELSARDRVILPDDANESIGRERTKNELLDPLDGRAGADAEVDVAPRYADSPSKTASKIDERRRA
jgi:hypothetical protein